MKTEVPKAANRNAGVKRKRFSNGGAKLGNSNYYQNDSEDADDLFNEIKTTNGSSNGAAKNGNGKHDSSDSKMDDEFDSLMDHSNASSVIIIF